MSLFGREDVDIIIHIYLCISLKMSIFVYDKKGGYHTYYSLPEAHRITQYQYE